MCRVMHPIIDRKEASGMGLCLEGGFAKVAKVVKYFSFLSGSAEERLGGY